MSKVIIFDMDGVLFDTQKTVQEFFFDAYPTMTPAHMDELLTGNFHEKLEEMKRTVKPKEETEEEGKARRHAYSIKKAKCPPYEGIPDLLTRLHAKGYKLVVNTSALERNCLPVFESNGLKEKFDFIATAEVSKSKVDKFRIIGEKYGKKPEELVFITDTVGDIIEAEIAGVPTIAVTWGAHNRAYFARDFKCLVAIVDTIGELEKRLTA